jgi:hypothetical protein
MQRDEEIRNPYWGSEMLSCGEVAGDLSLSSESTAQAGEGA